MNRIAAMKTLYLASAVGTLMLLGCSAADVSPETPQQAGKPGSAGSRGLLSGLAGAASTPSAGSGGAGSGGASGATVTAGATSGGAATAGAGTGGSSGALPGFGGFPSGGADSFSLGGYGGDDWIRTIIENSFAGDGSIGFGTGGTNSGSFQPSFGGVGGTRLWFSP